ncbi:zinc ribbon domain-containing protein [Dehalobacter sp. DCM]|uniref:zinc ribbon domain-containing protein n=1 Tax=Dehalobacter sp. DCM TaxID=2907827 RepID=UPI003081A47B|nr:zinc ribbon domain-containing protein [Dehalobacter sp. DCM]
MENNQNTLAGIEVYKLAPADIDHLFRRSGFNGNNLSPFRYNAEQAAVSSPSEGFKDIAGNPKFQQMARQLLEPNLRIEFNSGGGSAADDKYYALLVAESQGVLAQFTDSEQNILLVLFPDWEAFLNWWAGAYASKGMSGYQKVFPSAMEVEVLVCALHCIDIYRRSYMESMLDYRSGVNLTLTTQDFVQLLKRSLGSKDIRWLLPTLFEITPGLKNSSIALKPEHIQRVAELGFLTDKEGIITLAERSRIMGTEFITSWMGSFACQAMALINGEERSVSRVFMAMTAFTNHLISFESGGSGETRFRHQASNAQELINTLGQWMKALQKAIGNPAAGEKDAAQSKPEAPKKTEKNSAQNSAPNSALNNAPKVKFCGQCGTEIKPGKKFCGNCGTAV